MSNNSAALDSYIFKFERQNGPLDTTNTKPKRKVAKKRKASPPTTTAPPHQGQGGGQTPVRMVLGNPNAAALAAASNTPLRSHFRSVVGNADLA